jgi:hypothetical protein
MGRPGDRVEYANGWLGRPTMSQRLIISSGALLLAVVAAGPTHADEKDVDDYIRESTVKRELVIVKSSSKYSDALRVADEASRRLGIPLNLRELSLSEKGHLSFPKRVCEENGWDTPCYVPRGRFDDGVYVSVEHSSGYPELKRDLFMVIVASGSEKAADLKRSERAARVVFPDAYSRVVSVYMGCLH